MRNIFKIMLAGIGAVALSACSTLAPQTVMLDEQGVLPDEVSMTEQRSALIRVIDNRGVEPNYLGTRGGKNPDQSPLLSSRPLKDLLTDKLKGSLEKLGFGQAEAGGDPIKFQMDVNGFDYECVAGTAIYNCKISMDLAVSIDDGKEILTKNYRMNESREVLGSPEYRYNQDWINQSLNRLWTHMFGDVEVLMKLGASSQG